MTAPMRPDVATRTVTVEDEGRPVVVERMFPMGRGVTPAVHLSIPALPRYLRVARLTASGFATDLGFSVKEIDDLRVAVDELAAALIEGVPPEAMLDLVLRERGHGLEVDGRCTSRTSRPPTLDVVARGLLDVLADEYTFGAIDELRSFRLYKASGPG